jgi:hypothetical protein
MRLADPHPCTLIAVQYPSCLARRMTYNAAVFVATINSGETP